MNDYASLLGMAAAGLSVIGVAWAAAKKISQIAASLGQRIADIEQSLETKAQVSFSAEQLCCCPGAKNGVLMVPRGAIGTLQSLNDAGRCVVKLDGQTTLVITQLCMLTLAP